MAMADQLKGLYESARQKLINLNLFKSESTDPDIVRSQLLATRIFLILFSIALIILLSYTSISIQTKMETVQEPSLAEFQSLQNKYPDTLVCPCSQISIPYDRFVITKPSFHQVCSSDFVSQSWIDHTGEVDPTMILSIDIRTTLSPVWLIIANLCQNANNAIVDALQEFANNPLLSYTVISQAYLEIKTQAALSDAQSYAADRFARDFTTIQTIPFINGFMAGVGTNFNTNGPFRDPLNDYVLLVMSMAYPLKENGPLCFCVAQKSCPIESGVYFYTPTEYGYPSQDVLVPNITIRGIVFDCLPSLIALGSSLECFYDKFCIDTILNLYPRKLNVSRLYETETSRFPSTMILKEIVDQLFLEGISNTTSFSAYYKECAPTFCSYTYYGRFDTLFIITTFLGLIGGLTTALRLFAHYFVHFLLFLKKKLFRRNIIVNHTNGKHIR